MWTHDSYGADPGRCAGLRVEGHFRTVVGMGTSRRFDDPPHHGISCMGGRVYSFVRRRWVWWPRTASLAADSIPRDAVLSPRHRNGSEYSFPPCVWIGGDSTVSPTPVRGLGRARSIFSFRSDSMLFPSGTNRDRDGIRSFGSSTSGSRDTSRIFTCHVSDGFPPSLSRRERWVTRKGSQPRPNEGVARGVD